MTVMRKYKGELPQTLEELVKLPGVGRKTANLVVSDGYNKPAMCVDVHVNRISNRLGYVKTKDPFETEMAIREKLPLKFWKEYNFVLVAFGQHLCKPVSPFCSKCPVSKYCERVTVEKSR